MARTADTSGLAEHRGNNFDILRLFGAALETQFGRPVHYVDERLSSAAAAESLRAAGRGGRADKHLTHPLAAQHILQDWLDAYLAPDIPDDHSARR